MFALRLSPEIEQRSMRSPKRPAAARVIMHARPSSRQIEYIEDEYLARHRGRGGGSRATLKSMERDLARRTKSSRHVALATRWVTRLRR
jgi:hypothetical protein